MKYNARVILDTEYPPLPITGERPHAICPQTEERNTVCEEK